MLQRKSLRCSIQLALVFFVPGSLLISPSNQTLTEVPEKTNFPKLFNYIVFVSDTKLFKIGSFCKDLNCNIFSHIVVAVFVYRVSQYQFFLQPHKFSGNPINGSDFEQY